MNALFQKTMMYHTFKKTQAPIVVKWFYDMPVERKRMGINLLVQQPVMDYLLNIVLP